MIARNSPVVAIIIDLISSKRRTLTTLPPRHQAPARRRYTRARCSIVLAKFNHKVDKKQDCLFLSLLLHTIESQNYFPEALTIGQMGDEQASPERLESQSRPCEREKKQTTCQSA